MKITDIIIRPVVTEKATRLEQAMTYMFYVNPVASKVDVKNAIKTLYGHEVASVKMLRTPVKTRVMRKSLVNKRPMMKKAMITLKGKKKLDITKFAKESSKK